MLSSTTACVTKNTNCAAHEPQEHYGKVAYNRPLLCERDWRADECWVVVVWEDFGVGMRLHWSYAMCG